MRLLRRASRLVAATMLLGTTVLLGGMATIVAMPASAATKAPAATQDGWVRIAHLSPKAPAMDIYMYPFGNPGDPVVLHDVTYGKVSAYMAVSPGQYTVALRGFDASAASTPVLTLSFTVNTSTPYTVLAMGPDPGLRVEVLKDKMVTSQGRTLIRVVQASLKQHLVTVSYGSDLLARQLAFGSATPYLAAAPGAQTVQFTAPGDHSGTPVDLAADTVHTLVLLDGPSGLQVDDLTDSDGSKVMPAGGPDAGFGGTAPRLPANPAPWLAMIALGVLLSTVSLRRAACLRRAVGLRRAAGSGHRRWRALGARG